MFHLVSLVDIDQHRGQAFGHDSVGEWPGVVPGHARPFDQFQRRRLGLGVVPGNQYVAVHFVIEVFQVNRRNALKGRHHLDALAQDGLRFLGSGSSGRQAEYYLGVALTGLGDKQGAIESFKRAITADPKLVDAYVNLSAAELDAGDAGAALETANRGLKLAEQHPDLTLNRALALEALGKKDEALSAYGLAVRAAPKNLTLRLSYAQLLARANRRSEALSEIAAVRDSKDPRLLAVAANVARSLKAFADCLAVLDRALKLEDHPALHVRRGMCRQDSKDLAGAKSDFEQAIAMDDGFAPAHYYLGMTLRETDKKTACKELKRAAELGGDRGVGPEAKQAVSDLGCK